MTKLYDVIIIGGGLAGATAALYSSRKKLESLMITKDIGGQIAAAEIVENYPGIDSIKGLELANRIKKQAEKYKTKIAYDTVRKIDKKTDFFEIETFKNRYQSKAVILAFGKTPRNLDVPGEKKFLGHGVVYCAICDGPLFQNKDIIIVGGGNSAFSAAEYMLKIAKKIYLIHRREGFRADETLVEKIQKNPKAQFILNSVIESIKGEKLVQKVKIKNLKDNKISELNVQGVFVEIGYEVNSDFVKELIERDKYKQIIVNNKCETKTGGLFAAGDVTNSPYKQAIIAAGMGAVSALAAYDYLQERFGKSSQKIDWGKQK